MNEIACAGRPITRAGVPSNEPPANALKMARRERIDTPQKQRRKHRAGSPPNGPPEDAAQETPSRFITGSTPIGDEFLTEREASRLLKLSVRTLQRLREHGGGPAYMRLGVPRLPATERKVRGRPAGRVIYRRDELVRWATSQTYGSTSEETAKTAA